MYSKNESYFEKFNFIRHDLKQEGKDADLVQVTARAADSDFDILCPPLTVKASADINDLKQLDSTQFVIAVSGDAHDKNSWNCTTEPLATNKR